jgi:hypothetical protein
MEELKEIIMGIGHQLMINPNSVIDIQRNFNGYQGTYETEIRLREYYLRDYAQPKQLNKKLLLLENTL